MLGIHQMIEKLQEAERYFHAVSEKLSDPDTASDPVKYRDLMREYRRLSPIMEKYGEYSMSDAAVNEAQQILDEETDKELILLASEELRVQKETRERLYRELTVLLLPHDPCDDKNVVVEIRACAGGEEAALFAASLYRMYSMYAATVGYRLETVSANETELGGYREVSFLVEGEGAFSRLKFESGVHRVQRVPETESQGRIHTSTVSVAVLPEADEVDVEIDQNDLKIDTIKSTGAGGQHINKTESAIRILHKPTGIVVECQDERSQFKNRDKAMKILRSKLLSMKREEQDDKIASARRSQIGSGDRSEKIRTYNFPQSRMTDHRIGYTSYSLEKFLDGNIGELIDALAAADTAEKLKNNE